MAKPFNGIPLDYSPKKKVEQEVKLTFTPCLHCGKEIGDGFYGRFEGGGVCSKTCNTAQALKPKFPPPSKLFLQQMEQQDDLNDGFEQAEM